MGSILERYENCLDIIDQLKEENAILKKELTKSEKKTEYFRDEVIRLENNEYERHIGEFND